MQIIDVLVPKYSITKCYLETFQEKKHQPAFNYKLRDKRQLDMVLKAPVCYCNQTPPILNWICLFWTWINLYNECLLSTDGIVMETLLLDQNEQKFESKRGNYKRRIIKICTARHNKNTWMAQ